MQDAVASSENVEFLVYPRDPHPRIHLAGYQVLLSAKWTSRDSTDRANSESVILRASDDFGALSSRCDYGFTSSINVELFIDLLDYSPGRSTSLFEVS